MIKNKKMNLVNIKKQYDYWENSIEKAYNEKYRINKDMDFKNPSYDDFQSYLGTASIEWIIWKIKNKYSSSERLKSDDLYTIEDHVNDILWNKCAPDLLELMRVWMRKKRGIPETDENIENVKKSKENLKKIVSDLIKINSSYDENKSKKENFEENFESVYTRNHDKKN